ncbi:MAG: ABC transporter substrate-binding protein [Chlorobiales bacterium]|nr:ABC transporter substrate-binding protein [Chlorobiales bacterium]
MKKLSRIFHTVIFGLVLLLTVSGCQQKPAGVPSIGYVQIIEDATLDEAKRGFFDALKAAGFEDGKTMHVDYQNAQGDMVLLTQILDKFIQNKVDLIAANTTVVTIAAVQKTKDIPVCMMVAPRPDIAKLTGTDGSIPPNLCGTYETLAYIDTSVVLIKQIFPKAKRVGTVFNFAEPNSVNARNRLKATCDSLGMELVEASVASSNETQQVAASVMAKNIDVFFALPDNIIFASFETVYKLSEEKKIPIVSSEMGLVRRGAVMAYGTDFYEWGKQAGASAARVLKGEKGVKPDEVKIRKRVYNEAVAKALNITMPAGFEKVK